MVKHLNKAFLERDDEFYTRYEDIEAELQYYIPELKSQIIYCNCDDYRFSNFYKYFKDNFKKYKLKKLIATHYIDQQPSLFNQNIPKPLKAIYDGEKETIEKLKGDGSYKSPECIELLQGKRYCHYQSSVQ